MACSFLSNGRVRLPLPTKTQPQAAYGVKHMRSPLHSLRHEPETHWSDVDQWALCRWRLSVRNGSEFFGTPAVHL